MNEDKGCGLGKMEGVHTVNDNMKTVIGRDEIHEIRIFSGNRNSILREVGECGL